MSKAHRFNLWLIGMVQLVYKSQIEALFPLIVKTLKNNVFSKFKVLQFVVQKGVNVQTVIYSGMARINEDNKFPGWQMSVMRGGFQFYLANCGIAIINRSLQ